MKVLITQANRSEDIELLNNQLMKCDCDLVLFPEGYISNESLLEDCCKLAKDYNVPIISSYLDNKARKDVAVVIDEFGNKVLHRMKSSIEGPLLEPTKAIVNNINIGYMLCCEIFLDNIDFSDVEMIFNPIGVGMFSDDQFTEWSNRAKTLAERYNCYILGVSHADGSYRNCGISIPIAFVYAPNGRQVYLSKGDIRSMVIDLNSNEVEYL